MGCLATLQSLEVHGIVHGTMSDGGKIALITFNVIHKGFNISNEGKALERNKKKIVSMAIQICVSITKDAVLRL